MAPPLAENNTNSPAKPADNRKRCHSPADKNNHSSTKKPKKLFIYGNYDRYYGYRCQPPTDGAQSSVDARPHDTRLDAFRGHPHLFTNADCLDIGCNRGAVSFAVAGQLGARTVVGIDIDKTLIVQARQQLAAAKKQCPAPSVGHPHNLSFEHGNYVLGDSALLELERPQFDTILCLSLTKWIHLNFGDEGLRLAFRRMYRQLRAGGRLVLEAQDWKSYKRRKKLTTTIEQNFARIRMQPSAFGEYLLSDEVGFVRGWRMEMPAEHRAVGFRRPIWVYEKAEKVVVSNGNRDGGKEAVEEGAHEVSKEVGVNDVSGAKKTERGEQVENC